MGDVEVIVSDSATADEAATALAEGMVLGAAVAASADAQETADVAEATAEMAVAAVALDEDRLSRLEALLVAVHDEMLANDATLAEHLAVLLEAEEATMDEAEEATMEAATAEAEAAEVTEIVEEHAEQRAEEHAADEQSSESGQNEPEAPPAAHEAGQSRQHERAGGIRFRRGRR